jgi:membrane associated rhomboid family serine protease
MTELIEIRRLATMAEAERLALVLVAVGIPCHIAPGPGGVGLLVAADEARAARRQLDLYERENAAPPTSPLRPAPWSVEAALAYAALLVFLFVASATGLWSVDWLSAGAAAAGPIREGAVWRTMTTLTLHADLAHLLGNIAFGAVFALPVCRLLGTGLGWLAILMAGALGNELNALVRAPEHAAIGASTALFGALGILSSYAQTARARPWQGRIRRWAPVAAGIMLVTLVGLGGERTDVGAHLWGFAVGAVLGFGLARADGRIPLGPGAQALYGLVAAATLALAWLAALLRGGG